MTWAIGGGIARPLKLSQSLLGSLHVCINQGEIVVGTRVVRVDGERLLEIPLGVFPLPLEVETVAHVAEDVGVSGAGLQGLLIFLFSLAILALERLDVGQVQVRIATFLVAFERLAISNLGEPDVSLVFGGPAQSDLDVSLLRRSDALLETLVCSSPNGGRVRRVRTIHSQGNRRRFRRPGSFGPAWRDDSVPSSLPFPLRLSLTSDLIR